MTGPQPLTDQQYDEIAERLSEARLVADKADWMLQDYQVVRQQQADAAALLADNRRLRAEREEAQQELAAAVRVCEALHRRLSEEQLAGSALYAALTMPTTPEQRQAALDKFTAVAQQVFTATTPPAV